MNLNGSQVSGNTATGFGGGIFNETGSVTLNASGVLDNEGSRGGGIYGKGTITLVTGDLMDNRAHFGGGIFNDRGTVTLLKGISITSNNADDPPPLTGSGGGIFNQGTVNPVEGTITGNTPDDCIDDGSGSGCP